MSVLDRTGIRYGRLLALSVSKRTGRNNEIFWACRCDCGNEVTVKGASLGKFTNSCGCLQREVARSTGRELGPLSHKHGHTCRVNGKQVMTGTYKTWQALKVRCLNPNRPNYPYYGGRGITVCESWCEPEGRGFINVLADMGERPEGMSIDRINNDLGYSKENCRWATPLEQTRNRRVA